MIWEDFIEDMVDPDGSCFMVSSGVEITDDYIRSGIKFSWPVYKSGLQIMVAAAPEPPADYWAFTRPFSLHIWLAMGLTAMFIAVFIYSMERFSYSRSYTDRPGAWCHVVHKIGRCDPDFMAHPHQQLRAPLSASPAQV